MHMMLTVYFLVIYFTIVNAGHVAPLDGWIGTFCCIDFFQHTETNPYSTDELGHTVFNFENVMAARKQCVDSTDPNNENIGTMTDECGMIIATQTVDDANGDPHRRAIEIDDDINSAHELANGTIIDTRGIGCIELIRNEQNIFDRDLTDGLSMNEVTRTRDCLYCLQRYQFVCAPGYTYWTKHDGGPGKCVLRIPPNDILEKMQLGERYDGEFGSYGCYVKGAAPESALQYADDRCLTPKHHNLNYRCYTPDMDGRSGFHEGLNKHGRKQYPFEVDCNLLNRTSFFDIRDTGGAYVHSQGGYTLRGEDGDIHCSDHGSHAPAPPPAGFIDQDTVDKVFDGFCCSKYFADHRVADRQKERKKFSPLDEQWLADHHSHDIYSDMVPRTEEEVVANQASYWGTNQSCLNVEVAETSCGRVAAPVATIVPGILDFWGNILGHPCHDTVSCNFLGNCTTHKVCSDDNDETYDTAHDHDPYTHGVHCGDANTMFQPSDSSLPPVPHSTYHTCFQCMKSHAIACAEGYSFSSDSGKCEPGGLCTDTSRRCNVHPEDTLAAPLGAQHCLAYSGDDFISKEHCEKQSYTVERSCVWDMVKGECQGGLYFEDALPHNYEACKAVNDFNPTNVINYQRHVHCANTKYTEFRSCQNSKSVQHPVNCLNTEHFHNALSGQENTESTPQVVCNPWDPTTTQQEQKPIPINVDVCKDITSRIQNKACEIHQIISKISDDESGDVFFELNEWLKGLNTMEIIAVVAVLIPVVGTLVCMANSIFRWNEGCLKTCCGNRYRSPKRIPAAKVIKPGSVIVVGPQDETKATV